jgi:hypothetical protein
MRYESAVKLTIVNFFFKWTQAQSDKVFFCESNDVLKVIVWSIAD